MDFGLGCAAPNSYWEDLWEALDPDPLEDERPCTCHPDDNPPVPCPQKYALSECRAAAPAGPVAWMTHHDEPMLFPAREEATAYCDDDEEPIPLYAASIRDEAWQKEAMRLADEYAQAAKRWALDPSGQKRHDAARAALEAHLKSC